MKRFFTLLLVIISCFTLGAQTTLVGWDFSGNNGNESTATATTFSAGVETTLPSGIISRGADLNAASNADRFNAQGWSTAAAVDLSGADYMVFSIVPDAGFSLTLTSIDFSWQRSGTGPQSVVFTSSLDGHATILGSAFTSLSTTNNGLSLALPAGTFSNLTSTVTFRAYGFNAGGSGGSGGFEASTAGDDLEIVGTATSTGETILTGTTSPETFCLASGTTAAVDVPFTITGTYNSGNTFTAELSDAMGDFSSPTTIGTLSSTAAGTITATIPSSVSAGTGYRIRVVADNPATTGSDNGTDLEVATSIPAVTAASAAEGNGEVTLSWTEPTACADHVIVLMSEGSAVDATVSQANLDGLLDFSDYAANSAWDLRADANDIYDLSFNLIGADNKDYVALAANASTNSVTVTGLTNSLVYHFRIFLIYNTNEYGPAVDLTATPGDFCDKRLLITEYVEGSGQDKCIEIYNADNVSVNLSNFRLDVYSNGSTSAGTQIALNAVNLPPGGVYVVCNGSASGTTAPPTGFLGKADQTSILNHNGNDAIALHCPFGGVNLDVFGSIGQDPLTGWEGSVSGCFTNNQIWRRNSALGSAYDGSADFNPDDLYLCAGSITDESDLGIFGAAFPVELIGFEGEQIDESIRLSWTTSREESNDRFFIEKLNSYNQFEQYAEVVGAGFSETSQAYSLQDQTPQKGANIYRLSQVDFDGTFRILSTIEVDFESSHIGIGPISPNPVTDKIRLSLDVQDAEPVQATIYAIDGKEVYSAILALDGQSELEVNASDLPEGIYFLKLNVQGTTYRRSFIKR